MTRQLIARIIAEQSTKLECDGTLQGSTGKGNDQYQINNVFKFFGLNNTSLVPVREFNLTRDEEIVLSQFWGIPITEQIKGGDDKTMWCRSLASGAIALNQQIPNDIWLWWVPQTEAPDMPTEIEIEFAQGIPIALNGQRRTLDEIIRELNVMGGKNGIGFIDISEDGMMDLKSREIYEAPAAQIILKLHQDLELFCLTKEEIQFKKLIDSQWAYLVYHGCWYHPLKEALDSFIQVTQKVVNGTYRISIYKGNITILERSLPTSLFAPEMRSINAAGFDQRWCADAAKIRSLQWQVLAKRKLMMQSGDSQS
jgi:argininosuccinate synthase